METRRIGRLEVSAIALGGARLSLGEMPRERAVASIQAAVRAGVTLVDSAAAYVPHADARGHNEALFREALAGVPGGDLVAVATKGGHYRSADGFPIDGRPERLRSDCEASLRVLGRECIDLYFLHWPDPDVPIEESTGTLRDLRDEGKIRYIGLSNVSPEQLQAALRVADVAAVQNHFSIASRDSGMVEMTCGLGIAYLAYSPLRGAAESPALQRIAADRRCSPQRVALAWALAQAPNIIPIVGATRPETAVDSAGATTLQLSTGELAAISAA